MDGAMHRWPRQPIQSLGELSSQLLFWLAMTLCLAGSQPVGAPVESPPGEVAPGFGTHFDDPSGREALDQERWEKYRRADRAWRDAQPVTNGSPGPEARAARQVLDDLSTAMQAEPVALPRLFALVEESLGDWEMRWGTEAGAWRFYAETFAWHGASPDLAQARRDYLSLLWKIGWESPPHQTAHWPETFPLTPLENGLRLAVEPGDLARLHYLLAIGGAWRASSPPQLARVGESFAAALNLAPDDAGWLPEAILAAARWAEQHGRRYYDDAGDLQLEPDYAQALLLYRMAPQSVAGERIPEAKRSEIEAAIQRIEAPVLAIDVDRNFRPGSEPRARLRWRNLPQVEVRLFHFSPTTELDMTRLEAGAAAVWAVDLSIKAPLWSQTFAEAPRAPHHPVETIAKIQAELPPGAYLLEARAGLLTDRDFLVISDYTLAAVAGRDDLTVFLAHAVTGAPVPNARLVWLDPRPGGDAWRRKEAVTGADGLVRWGWESSQDGLQSGWLAGEAEGVVAISLTPPRLSLARPVPAALFGWTDRAVYSPGENVRWVATVRLWAERDWMAGSGRIRLACLDPQGQTVYEGDHQLNEAGQASGEWPLPATSQPGAYDWRWKLTDAIGQGGAMEARTERGLFRVATTPPNGLRIELESPQEETGGILARPLGEEIPLSLQVLHPGRQPAANATVEVAVLQRSWRGLEDLGDPGPGGSPPPPDSAGGLEEAERQVINLTLQTDLRGRASCTLQASESTTQDYECLLQITARDGRTAEGQLVRLLRLTRPSFQARLESRRRLYHPDEDARLELTTRDAAGRPVAAEGVIRLTRQTWREVWVDRRGRDITGQALRELQGRSGGWFTFGPTASDYRLLSEGFEVREISVTPLRTGREGLATFDFRTPGDGYFKATWVGRDQRSQPVKAEWDCWVASPGEGEFSHRGRQLEAIVEQHSVMAGTRAGVLISAPSPNRYVLLFGGPDAGRRSELLGLTGTGWRLDLPCPPAAVPGTWVQALMLADQAMVQESRLIGIEPPAKELNVEITCDQPNPKPGEVAVFEIRTGQPGARISFRLGAKGGDVRGRIAWSLTPPPGPAPVRWGGEVRPFYDTPPASAGQAAGPSLKTFGLFRLLSEAAPPTPGVPIAAAFDKWMAPLWRPEEPPLVWLTGLTADSDGLARVSIQLPLTARSLVAEALAVDAFGAVGRGALEATIEPPMQLAIAAPDWVRVGDICQINGTASLEGEDRAGLDLRLEAGGSVELEATAETIFQPGHSNSELGWPVRAVRPGRGSLRLVGHPAGRQGVAVGAAQSELTVVERAWETNLSQAGWSAHGREEIVLLMPLQIPAETVRGEIMASPSLLPFLIRTATPTRQWPWADTESRLLGWAPGLLLQQTMTRMQFNPTEVANALRLPAPGQEAPWLGRQTAAGGWSWIPGGTPDPYVTAHILWWNWAAAGREGGEPSGFEAARRWLLGELTSEKQTPEARAWFLCALAQRGQPGKVERPNRLEARAFLENFRGRAQLSPAGRACLAIASRRFGFDEEAALLAGELEKLRQRETDSTGAVRSFWIASGEARPGWSVVEGTALGLLATIEADPAGHETADSVARWLWANRTDPDGWGTPRESALALRALAGYVEWTAEEGAALDFQVRWNGRLLGGAEVRPGTVLRVPQRWELAAGTIEAGENRLAFAPLGAGGGLWYNVSFAQPAAIRSGMGAAASERIAIERRLLRVRGVPTLLSGYIEEKQPWSPEEGVRVGERLEVVLSWQVPEDWRHTILMDPTAAGCAVQSFEDHLVVALELKMGRERDRQPGEDPDRYTGRQVQGWVELTPGEVRFYFERLEPGRWEVRYFQRALWAGLFQVPAPVAEIENQPLNRPVGTALELKIEPEAAGNP